MQVGIDLIGPLQETPRGNKYIVTLVDYFSKSTSRQDCERGCSLPLQDDVQVMLFLDWIHQYCTIVIYTLNMLNDSLRYGCTKIVISDQGREFVNHVSQELFELTKTRHQISTAYHPQTNGLVERFNQTMQRSLLKLVKKEQDDWDQYIDGVLFGYRTAIQKSTKKTPIEVMYSTSGTTYTCS